MKLNSVFELYKVEGRHSDLSLSNVHKVLLNMKVEVVGAGINGLSAAYCLAERFPFCDITITSADNETGNCSEHGFGLVITRKLGIMDHDDVTKFVQKTRDYCHDLSPEEARERGIELMEILSLINFHENNTRKAHKRGPVTPVEVTNLIGSGIDVRRATEREMQEAGYVEKNRGLAEVLEDNNISNVSLQGYISHHYVIDPTVYLPWLRRRLDELTKSNGRIKRVNFVNRKLVHFSDLQPCDLIINCSGVGARELCDDPYVLPMRGQYFSLTCPVKRCFCANHIVIVPRRNDTAVAGVYQVGRWDCQTEPEDPTNILRQAEAVSPALKAGEIRKVDVGIAPGRIGGPRVEVEFINAKGGNGKTPIIHNYGHGPRGIAQHWGCAQKVTELAAEYFKLSSNL
ncbi:unnamed protein product [Clavelina lepadiformis]|uniref:FAD dependent oxidoreductase domain-containing protein n=1 Tax=Clavelina lepadiformis TaxID=159417 RepID=A0ABP0EZX2_CLALP